MTYCLGIKVNDGIVALADTRITRGSERLSKGKLALLNLHGPAFLMTSGLRSVRDKAVTYLEEQLASGSHDFRRMHEVATSFGEQLRRVREEDGAALARGGLTFNLHAVIGGRLADDPESAMYYIYPEGNWIEAGADSPYFAMGRTPYGKPILDRLLRVDTALPAAVALAYLAFDATRTSVNDVDFPLDLLVYDAREGTLRSQRVEEHALASTAVWWQGRLAEAVAQMPMAWASDVLEPTQRAGAIPQLPSVGEGGGG